AEPCPRAPLRLGSPTAGNGCQVRSAGPALARDGAGRDVPGVVDLPATIRDEGLQGDPPRGDAGPGGVFPGRIALFGLAAPVDLAPDTTRRDRVDRSTNGLAARRVPQLQLAGPL